jgi:hypothetical protein
MRVGLLNAYAEEGERGVVVAISLGAFRARVIFVRFVNVATLVAMVAECASRRVCESRRIRGRIMSASFWTPSTN